MVNKVILIGRLGKDPEVKHLSEGVVMAKFPLATDEHFKNKMGERESRTEWHNISVWRKQAEIAEQYLKKGSLVYIEGRLRTRSYEENGNKKYFTEVVADNFQMLGKKDDTGSNRMENTSAPSASDFNIDEKADDDLPF